MQKGKAAEKYRLKAFENRGTGRQNFAGNDRTGKPPAC